MGTGYITEPNNVKEMAGRVLTLAEDAGLRQKMGKLARSHMEAEFSFEHNQEKILDLITPAD